MNTDLKANDASSVLSGMLTKFQHGSDQTMTMTNEQPVPSARTGFFDSIASLSYNSAGIGVSPPVPAPQVNPLLPFIAG